MSTLNEMVAAKRIAPSPSQQELTKEEQEGVARFLLLVADEDGRQSELTLEPAPSEIDEEDDDKYWARAWVKAFNIMKSCSSLLKELDRQKQLGCRTPWGKAITKQLDLFIEEYCIPDEEARG